MTTKIREGALKRCGVAAASVEACYMGNVLSAGVGQAPARQAALAAGLSDTCVCTTINKVCASGLKAITLAAQEIALGYADVVVAGGMENMSQVPHYVDKMRFGMRMGNSTVVDGIVHDGLTDAHESVHMGMCAEACAGRFELTRAMQDAHARSSYARSRRAWADGRFKDEVVAVSSVVSQTAEAVERDEECERIELDAIEKMRPAFRKDGMGTVTRGNASGLNDGAAAVVLMSAKAASEQGIAILGRIAGFADAEQEPVQFTTTPAVAISSALRRARVDVSDVDVFEVNEAFSVVALANTKLLGVSEDKVNVWGGAVSMGHPLGCSGARIVVTLLSVMRFANVRCGVAGVCNGGGGATALVVERNVVW